MSPSPTFGNTKRQRTRQLLLEAAAALVRENGFENTSMEAVATRAGMTRGAIYGNFKDRDALFLALVAPGWQPIVPRFRLGASFGEQMHALAAAVIAVLPERRKSAVGAASLRLYALKHDAMRLQLLALQEDIHRQTARTLLQFNAASELPMPVDTLVRVLHVMTEGILLQGCLSPDQMGDDVIFAAFAALAPP